MVIEQDWPLQVRSVPRDDAGAAERIDEPSLARPGTEYRRDLIGNSCLGSDVPE
jgi:hypothetical protein